MKRIRSQGRKVIGTDNDLVLCIKRDPVYLDRLDEELAEQPGFKKPPVQVVKKRHTIPVP